MPPLRSGLGRASKACDACRKQKTRCYASESPTGACLRCETLSQHCSLNSNILVGENSRQDDLITAETQAATARASTDERLDRLEKTVSDLVKRLDQRPDYPQPEPDAVRSQVDGSSGEPNQAPVFLIRDIATDAGVSPEQSGFQSEEQSDIISKGLITLQDAFFLLSIFHKHYSRWVRFDEHLSTENLLTQVKKSSLLLCSICLIAVRHTTQEFALVLAPRLFQEAKSLVAASLLTVPQSVEFFQAALILSLWSTSIGQVPLSIDSWLLSGYALQQALASPLFAEVLRPGTRLLSGWIQLNAGYIWNHICFAHLQFCVGTRRRALLNRTLVDRCHKVLDSDHVTNFETRMVAEVELYWIIYEKCSASPVDLVSTRESLSLWKHEWATLFDQPRSQFLQMGYSFALLLAFCQSLRTSAPTTRETTISEMINLSKAIIDVAVDTTDERTQHLTDHIYHIITFSAITLCRLLNTYEDKLRGTHDVPSLDALVTTLVAWLRSIGLSCHVAHMLGDVVSAQHKKLRPNAQPVPYAASDTDHSVTADFAFMYPEFVSSGMFDINDTEFWWPL